MCFFLILFLFFCDLNQKYKNVQKWEKNGKKWEKNDKIINKSRKYLSENLYLQIPPPPQKNYAFLCIFYVFFMYFLCIFYAFKLCKIM